MSASSIPRDESRMLEANRRFYDPLWQDARLIEAERFNTWPLVSSLLSPSVRRLEVAPGLRPRLPIEGTHFVDFSTPAVTKLRAHGATAVLGTLSALPFPDAVFGLVCALDIVEHVDDENGALSELSRVTAPGGALLLSVPLHPSYWTPFDDFVGHRRRYEPERLYSKLTEHGFSIERSAGFGMKPKSSRLVNTGMWFLAHQRKRAMWWYNNIFQPLSVRFQKKLDMAPGMIATDNIAEVLLLCRRSGAAPA